MFLGIEAIILCLKFGLAILDESDWKVSPTRKIIFEGESRPHYPPSASAGHYSFEEVANVVEVLEISPGGIVAEVGVPRREVAVWVAEDPLGLLGGRY